MIEEEHRVDTHWYMYEYYFWGLIHVAMIIIGPFITSWYRGLVINDAWFKIQCPLIQYNASTANVAPVQRFDGSATTTSVGDNGWSQASCLDAAPVY